MLTLRITLYPPFQPSHHVSFNSPQNQICTCSLWCTGTSNSFRFPSSIRSRLDTWKHSNTQIYLQNFKELPFSVPIPVPVSSTHLRLRATKSASPLLHHVSLLHYNLYFLLHLLLPSCFLPIIFFISCLYLPLLLSTIYIHTHIYTRGIVKRVLNIKSKKEIWIQILFYFSFLKKDKKKKKNKNKNCHWPVTCPPPTPTTWPGFLPPPPSPSPSPFLPSPVLLFKGVFLLKEKEEINKV